MNLNRKENRIPLQILLISMLCLGLLTLVYVVAFRRSPLDAEAQQIAKSTKTALALTAGSLLGPFPTSTVPTPTASDTPTLTPIIPTATPSVTRTPSPTRTLIPTFTPRTKEPNPIIRTSTPVPPSTSTTAPIVPKNPLPTNPPPTRTPVDTQPPPPTNEPPTDEPPTDEPPPTNPPQPTDIIDVINTLLPIGQ